jgi:hypothetical protein
VSGAATTWWDAGISSAGDAGGRDYVFVDVLPTHVLVTHNTGRGSYQIEVILGAIETLKDLGLHVWDPQQGRWFP